MAKPRTSRPGRRVGRNTSPGTPRRVGPKRMARVKQSGTKMTNMARSARMNAGSRRSTPDSTGSFNPSDAVPQWNLFRNIADNIRRATRGGR